MPAPLFLLSTCKGLAVIISVITASLLAIAVVGGNTGLTLFHQNKSWEEFIIPTYYLRPEVNLSTEPVMKVNELGISMTYIQVLVMQAHNLSRRFSSQPKMTLMLSEGSDAEIFSSSTSNISLIWKDPKQVLIPQEEGTIASHLEMVSTQLRIPLRQYFSKKRIWQAIHKIANLFANIYYASAIVLWPDWILVATHIWCIIPDVLNHQTTKLLPVYTKRHTGTQTETHKRMLPPANSNEGIIPVASTATQTGSPNMDSSIGTQNETRHVKIDGVMHNPGNFPHQDILALSAETSRLAAQLEEMQEAIKVKDRAPQEEKLEKAALQQRIDRSEVRITKTIKREYGTLRRELYELAEQRRSKKENGQDHVALDKTEREDHLEKIRTRDARIIDLESELGAIRHDKRVKEDELEKLMINFKANSKRLVKEKRTAENIINSQLKLITLQKTFIGTLNARPLQPVTTVLGYSGLNIPHTNQHPYYGHFPPFATPPPSPDFPIDAPREPRNMRSPLISSRGDQGQSSDRSVEQEPEDNGGQANHRVGARTHSVEADNLEEKEREANCQSPSSNKEEEEEYQQGDDQRSAGPIRRHSSGPEKVKVAPVRRHTVA